jgi:quercetin dioxygenase-like cupin family protein
MESVEMEIPVVDWSSTEWTPVREGVHRKTFSGTGFSLALHRLEPHQKPNPHSHPNEQAIYVLQGRGRYHVGGNEFILGPGGVLCVPAGVLHWAEVVGDEDVIALDIFVPGRA